MNSRQSRQKRAPRRGGFRRVAVVQLKRRFWWISIARSAAKFGCKIGESQYPASMHIHKRLCRLLVPEGEHTGQATIESGLHRSPVRTEDGRMREARIDVAVANDERVLTPDWPGAKVVGKFNDFGGLTLLMMLGQRTRRTTIDAPFPIDQRDGPQVFVNGTRARSARVTLPLGDEAPRRITQAGQRQDGNDKSKQALLTHSRLISAPMLHPKRSRRVGDLANMNCRPVAKCDSRRACLKADVWKNDVATPRADDVIRGGAGLPG